MISERISQVLVLHRDRVQCTLDHLFNEELSVAQFTDLTTLLYWLPRHLLLLATLNYVGVQRLNLSEQSCLLKTLLTSGHAAELTVTVVQVAGLFPLLMACVASFGCVMKL